MKWNIDDDEKKDQINCSSLAYVLYEERYNTRNWLLLKNFSLTRKAQKSVS